MEEFDMSVLSEATSLPLSLVQELKNNIPAPRKLKVIIIFFMLITFEIFQLVVKV